MRHADPHSKQVIIAALQLPSKSHFVSKEGNKRLKSIDQHTIMDEAQSQQLPTVLKAPQHGVQQLITLPESHVESEKKF